MTLPSSRTKYILDTHALIWFLEGNSRLSDNVKAILSEPEHQFVLPAIALAEAVWIVSRGKTSIPSVEALLDAVKRDSRVSVYPLDQAVIEQTVRLNQVNEMHDRQIVSTALILHTQGETVALLTCDKNITAANVVPIVW